MFCLWCDTSKRRLWQNSVIANRFYVFCVTCVFDSLDILIFDDYVYVVYVRFFRYCPPIGLDI